MIFEERLEGGEGSSQQMSGARASQAESTSVRARVVLPQPMWVRARRSMLVELEAKTSRRHAQRGKDIKNSDCLGTPNHIIAGSSPFLRPFPYEDHCLPVHLGETAFVSNAFLTRHAAACFSDFTWPSHNPPLTLFLVTLAVGLAFSIKSILLPPPWLYKMRVPYFKQRPVPSLIP